MSKTDPSPPPDMIHIEGGRFRMGSDHHYSEEVPAHDVMVGSFWIDRTPGTNWQFEWFVSETGNVMVAEVPREPRRSIIFPPMATVFTTVIGNVWERTGDWLSARLQPDAAKPCCIPKNPRSGRAEQSYDPAQPQIPIPRKAIKGGSVLCAPN